MRRQRTLWLVCLSVLAAGAVAAPVAHEEPPPLEGTRWVLTALGDDAVEGAVPGREPSLELRPLERRVHGLTACNRFSGTYTLDGERLTFGPLAVTRMACVDGPPIELRYLRALGDTVSWRISGRDLELFDKTEEKIARFEARLPE